MAPARLFSRGVDMDLTIMDRVLLLNILPAEGSITTLRIVRQLREDLSFSEKDHEDFKLVVEDGQIKWDPALATTKSIEFGKKAEKLVVEALQKLSRDNKLTLQYVDLYSKFIPEDGE